MVVELVGQVDDRQVEHDLLDKPDTVSALKFYHKVV